MATKLVVMRRLGYNYSLILLKLIVVSMYKIEGVLLFCCGYPVKQRRNKGDSVKIIVYP